MGCTDIDAAAEKLYTPQLQALGVTFDAVRAAMAAFEDGMAQIMEILGGLADQHARLSTMPPLVPQRVWGRDTCITRPPRVLGAPDAPWRPDSIRQRRRHRRYH